MICNNALFNHKAICAKVTVIIFRSKVPSDIDNFFYYHFGIDKVSTIIKDFKQTSKNPAYFFKTFVNFIIANQNGVFRIVFNNLI